ncbi:MAG: type VI secretion system baseplate subunit TssG [Myxococcales bacterium]|nr:type VI secretion system baseplate subunit TssG [Myxococcales bacterium]
MGSHEWPETRPLIDALESEPHRFEFDQAIRLVEMLVQPEVGLADSGDPAAEAVKLRAEMDFAFPASVIRDITLIRNRYGVMKKAELKTALLSLAGVLGPLPLAFSDMLMDRRARRDTAMRDFLDIFNHRLMSILNRIRVKSRIRNQWRHPVEQTMARYLFSVAGMGTDGTRGRLGVPDACALFYSAHFGRRPDSVSGLEAMLSDFFGVESRVLSMKGKWFDLDPAERTALGVGGGGGGGFGGGSGGFGGGSGGGFGGGSGGQGGLGSGGFGGGGGSFGGGGGGFGGGPGGPGGLGGGGFGGGGGGFGGGPGGPGGPSGGGFGGGGAGFGSGSGGPGGGGGAGFGGGGGGVGAGGLGSGAGLGGRNNALGVSAALGGRAFDAAGGFDIEVRPKAVDLFEQFMPGGSAFDALCKLTRLYVGPGPEFGVVVRATLPGRQPKGLSLSNTLRLGWTTYAADRVDLSPDAANTPTETVVKIPTTHA